MPDPAKENDLKAYNSIELWMEAEGKRLTEHVISFDKRTRIHRNCLYAPLDVDLNIYLAVRSKGPVKSDLAVERGNHHVLQISHFFNLENGDTSKFPFHIGSIAASNNAMLPPLSEEVGEIKIDVYKASLVKSNRGTKSSERTSLPAITAHVTELGGTSCCIRASPAEPCTNDEMKSIYRPSEPYKADDAKPLISFVYEYHERMDDAGGADTKAGITEALGKRVRRGEEGVVQELRTEVGELRQEMKEMHGVLKGLAKGDKRGRKRLRGLDPRLYSDDEVVDVDDLESRHSTHTPELGGGGPLSAIDGDDGRPRRRGRREGTKREPT
ncbi:uncharacterized protein MKK02DRAFT_43519 [Dioszegia hungarica]|uniref:Uncharacterized protein n=1 Tax=Dioszegia hungarica TaxID=4972 RepID=A0AA38HC47_9TREE|nr:uncharacterized protein MKK02DRAFT_43519 [Dioszegia hungarica]KAI9637593.1 hypothetical protein MKK02DRAFT_43519 [Dioszegia hungarica]